MFENLFLLYIITIVNIYNYDSFKNKKYLQKIKNTFAFQAIIQIQHISQ